MLMVTGIMKKNVALLGTSLKLKEGEHVYLTFPSNQPDPKGKWFARPINGWSDGIERLDQHSILLEPGDAELDEISKREFSTVAVYLYFSSN